MKALIFLILLYSCQEPVVEPVCNHTVQWNPDTERAEVVVSSDLDQVQICYSSGTVQHCFFFVRHYYECISFAIPDDETVITIIAEETCEYIL